MIKLIEFKNDNHSFPHLFSFPAASPLDSHLSSSLLPQPSPHRHHVYSILLTPSFSTTPFLAINSPPFHISENSTVRGSSSTGLFAGFLADISIVRSFFDGRAPKENKSS